MKLIIQIPCYNEEKTLDVTIRDLPRHIDGVDAIEYLIINDGSKDHTVARARELGVEHIVNFKRNKGLAYGFMAGLDACLHLGADIIVNTDADNQYCGADIEKLIAPILAGPAGMVVGVRPIDETEHFSQRKKAFQHLGSWVVRKASGTDIPDAPSGFRAYSRDAALRINVTNDYTYTLETIIQAGRNRTAITSVPIRTNPELRKSRLFKSMWTYMKRSASVISRSYVMYSPLKFFGSIGAVIFLVGVVMGARLVYYTITEPGNMHLQSLILTTVLLLLGAQTFFLGLQADMIAKNRKLLEDVQYRLRRSTSSIRPDDLLTDEQMARYTAAQAAEAEAKAEAAAPQAPEAATAAK
ncbi:MAG: glycosyltransferase family 2 protein [Gemmiger sp.]|nr:glycosyltransferase family 2 protein [Gemmiger sp.]